MPTPHRQQMVEAGYSDPHHGHDPHAVKINAALDAENQAKLDEAAAADEAALRAAEEAQAAKRAAQAERHRVELARRRGKRTKAA